jgi:HlyD family secretion protein
VKKRRIVIVVLIIAGIVIFLGLNRAKNKNTNKKPATTVRLEKPVRGDFTEYATCPGQIGPKKKVTISARVSARIVELPFKVRQKVTKGDPNAKPPILPSVLVRLDATDLETALKIAESRKAAQQEQIKMEKASIQALEDSLKSTEATLKMAELEYKRMEGLLQTKDISQSDYDRAKTTYDELSAKLSSDKHRLESAALNINVLEHNLKALEADIHRAEESLTYTTIVSPIDGVVTQLNAEVGEIVIFGTMNNPGTVIIEVADMSKMLVATEIDEVEIGKVKIGQKAKIRIPAFPDRTFTGIVDTVALKSTMSRVGSSFYKAEVLLDSNGVDLYSGLTADVDIEVKTYRDVLKVPTQSTLGREVDSLPSDIRDNKLVDKNKTYATVVYKFKDGKAVVTPVKMGPSDISYTVIESGIDSNDVIVTGPYKVLESLQHDQEIKEEKKEEKNKLSDVNSIKDKN